MQLKKITSVFLLLCLLTSIFPAQTVALDSNEFISEGTATAAADNTTETDTEFDLFSSGSINHYTKLTDSDTITHNESLSTPESPVWSSTGVQWLCCWTDPSKKNTLYIITIYDQNNNICTQYFWEMVYNSSGRYNSADDFVRCITKSGTYHFGVAAAKKVDSHTYEKGTEVFSASRVFKLPYDKLSVPEEWYIRNRYFYWTVSDCEIEIQIYYSDTIDGEKTFVYGYHFYNSDSNYYLEQAFTKAGYWAFRVRGLTKNYDARRNSPYGSFRQYYYDGNSVISYTVTYHTNIGPASTTHQFTGLALDTSFPIIDAPERTGYVFDGWYTNSACTGTPFEPAKQTVRENITLYAKWSLPDPFSVPDDVPGFLNAPIPFCGADYFDVINLKSNPYHYEISDKDFNILLENFPSLAIAEKAAVSYMRRKLPWGGSCNGMSAISLLNYVNMLDLSTLGENIHDVSMPINTRGSKDVSEIESLITFLHMLQVEPVMSEKKMNYSSSESENLKNLIQKAKEQKPYPVIINLNLIDPDDPSVKNGHTVLGYDYNYNYLTGTYSVKIYDSSLSADNFFEMQIRKEDEIYVKSCTEWEEDWTGWNIFITSVITADDYRSYNSFPYPYDNRSALLKETSWTAPLYYELATNYNSMQIRAGEITTIITDGSIDGDDDLGLEVIGNTGEIQIDDSGNYFSNMNFRIRIPKGLTDIGNITVLPVSESGFCNTEILFSDSELGFFHATETEQPVAISFNADGDLFTSAENSTGQIVYSSFSRQNNDFIYASFDAETSGIHIGLNESDQVTATYAEDTITTITIGKGIKEQSATVSYESSSGSLYLSADEENETETNIMNGDDELSSIALGYSVIFDAQGGYADTVVNVAENETLVEPDEPVYEGYIFKGWYIDEKKTVLWDPDDPITKDLVVYAKWQSDEGLYKTVSFCADGCDPQRIRVLPGTAGNTITVPDSDNFSNCNVVWDADELDALQASIITEDVVIHGSFQPCLDGSTLSFTNNYVTSTQHIVKARNNSSLDWTAYVAIEFYGEDGKHLETKGRNVTFKKNSTTTITISLPFPQECSSAKIFLFYGDNYLPLCNSCLIYEKTE